MWTAFSIYFEPKTNYRLARYQLRDIKQNSNEPVDSYISRLRTQAKKCNYQPDALEDMLIDQFIVGVAHDSVHKHILDEKPDELTLDMCLQFVRTHEATASPIWSISIQQCRQCQAYIKTLVSPQRLAQIIQIPEVTVQITEEKIMCLVWRRTTRPSQLPCC